jgi:hypothetical protein
MDQVDRAMVEYNARSNASAPSKIDALLDLEQLSDARVVPFLVQVAVNVCELPAVRVHALRVLRNRHHSSRERISAGRAIGHILTDGSDAGLRSQAAITLAEFTDVEGVPDMLGAVALDDSEPLDLRYLAFTSLERAGPQPECLIILRTLSLDETLGRSARRLLSTWSRT